VHFEYADIGAECQESLDGRKNAVGLQGLQARNSAHQRMYVATAQRSGLDVCPDRQHVFHEPVVVGTPRRFAGFGAFFDVRVDQPRYRRITAIAAPLRWGLAPLLAMPTCDIDAEMSVAAHCSPFADGAAEIGRAKRNAAQPATAPVPEHESFIAVRKYTDDQSAMLENADLVIRLTRRECLDRGLGRLQAFGRRHCADSVCESQ